MPNFVVQPKTDGLVMTIEPVRRRELVRRGRLDFSITLVEALLGAGVPPACATHPRAGPRDQAEAVQRGFARLSVVLTRVEVALALKLVHALDDHGDSLRVGGVDRMSRI